MDVSWRGQVPQRFNTTSCVPWRIVKQVPVVLYIQVVIGNMLAG